MTANDAIEYARDDFKRILGAASYGMQALMGSEQRDLVLVDGSMYSPSWRALRGGAIVHDEGDDLGDAAETYTEELDRLTDAWTGPDGQVLYWEEGMLFIGVPSDEPDAA